MTLYSGTSIFRCDVLFLMHLAQLNAVSVTPSGESHKALPLELFWPFQQAEKQHRTINAGIYDDPPPPPLMKLYYKYVPFYYMLKSNLINNCC